MENKEVWIKRTLESIDNIQPVDVSPQLAERLLFATRDKNNIRSIKPMAKWAVAASIVLLAGINVISILHYKKPTAVQATTNPLYNEYFSFLSEY